MNDRDLIILRKIQKYSREAISYVEEIDYDTFISDNKTLSATAGVDKNYG